MRWVRQHPWIVLGIALICAVLAYFAVSSSQFLLEAVGRLPVSVSFLLTWVAVFPNEAKKIVAEVVGVLFYWSRRGQRIAVGTGIEADVARATSRVDAEAPGLFTRAFKIQWHRGKAGHVDLPEGELIVKLRDHRQQGANLTTAIVAHVRNSSLARARLHLDRDVNKAVEFGLVSLMLEGLDQHAASAFRDEVCLPACEDSDRLATVCDWTRVLDSQGLFTRVAVTELTGLGSRLAGQLPSASAAEESYQFLSYLHRIATKAHGEDLSDELKFHRAHLSLGVVLVARPEIYAIHGDSAYTGRVGQYAKEGVAAVYLVGRGMNVEYSKSVSTQLRGHGNVTSVDEFEFDVVLRGITRPAYVARVALDLRLSRRAERRFAVLREARGSGGSA